MLPNDATQLPDIADVTVITAGPEAYAEFLRRLDAPPNPNDRLRRSLLTPEPWEK
jgi:uncharacterized protein (DUF1778 family)